MRFSVTPFTSLLIIGSLFSAANAEDTGSASGGDAVKGKALFQQNCAICHATGQGDRPQAGQGPALAGVVGRPAAALTNFGYTKALANSHLVWDAGTLDKFLASPSSVVPGTAMVIPTPNTGDRSNLIAFLSTLKASAPVADQPPKSHARTDGDWENDAPGKTHRINLAQLPAPYATESAGNSPKTVDRPAGANL